jgi:hypothetical protein
LIRHRYNTVDFAQNQFFCTGSFPEWRWEFQLLFRFDARRQPTSAPRSMTNVDLGHDSDLSGVTLPQGLSECLRVLGVNQVDCAPSKPAAREASANQTWKPLRKFHHGIALVAAGLEILAITPVSFCHQPP